MLRLTKSPSPDKADDSPTLTTELAVVDPLKLLREKQQNVMKSYQQRILNLEAEVQRLTLENRALKITL